MFIYGLGPGNWGGRSGAALALVGHMSKKTTITHPDGTKTTIAQTGGCGSSCTWVFAILLVLGSCLEAPVLWIPTIGIGLVMLAILGTRHD
jgi:hypothetical protein